jgi:sugar lactone lactonase YvrE
LPTTLAVVVALIAALLVFATALAPRAEGYVYWAKTDPRLTENPWSIGRANPDGSGVDQSFISDPGYEAGGLAVDGAHVYWTQFTGAINRANLDGTEVNQDFIAQVRTEKTIFPDPHPEMSPRTEI